MYLMSPPSSITVGRMRVSNNSFIMSITSSEQIGFFLLFNFCLLLPLKLGQWILFYDDNVGLTRHMSSNKRFDRLSSKKLVFRIVCLRKKCGQTRTLTLSGHMKKLIAFEYVLSEMNLELSLKHNC